MKIVVALSEESLPSWHVIITEYWSIDIDQYISSKIDQQVEMKYN